MCLYIHAWLSNQSTDLRAEKRWSIHRRFSKAGRAFNCLKIYEAISRRPIHFSENPAPNGAAWNIIDLPCGYKQ
jgi:hypothetical protein